MPKLLQTCPFRRATDGNIRNQWFPATDLTSLNTFPTGTNVSIQPLWHGKIISEIPSMLLVYVHYNSQFWGICNAAVFENWMLLGGSRSIDKEKIDNKEQTHFPHKPKSEFHEAHNWAHSKRRRVNGLENDLPTGMANSELVARGQYLNGHEATRANILA